MSSCYHVYSVTGLKTTVPGLLDTVQTRQYHRIRCRGIAITASALLGISPVVGRLTLNQEAEVRTLHPQPFLSFDAFKLLLALVGYLENQFNARDYGIEA